MSFSKTVKLRFSPDLHIGAAVSPTGRPLVVIDSDAELVEDLSLTAVEARRLAKVLVLAAATAEFVANFEKREGRYGQID